MIRVCAVVPLYNEEENAQSTISALLKVNSIDCIVAVDDGSTDGTWDKLQQIERVILVRHHKNMGKSKAVMDGVNCCDAEVYVFVDGDLGSSAANIGPVIDQVINGGCDMCVAKMPEKRGTGGIGFLKWFSRYAVRRLTGMDFPCPMSGQRAARACLVKDHNVHMYSGYGIEVGMLIDALQAGYKVIYMDCEFMHDVTLRDFKGYLHRFRQFIDIWDVFIRKLLR